MKLRSAVVVFALFPTFASAQIDRIAVYGSAGRSFRTWHGQADVQVLNIEFAHAISPRSEIGFVFAPINLWQPRSWFGDQYGDGNENVRAVSGSLLFRHHFHTASPRVQYYVEGSSGPMWAEKAVPASTSRFNFVSQIGGGALLMPHSRYPVFAGYRFMHVSNGGYSPRNPGLNISALMFGVQLRR